MSWPAVIQEWADGVNFRLLSGAKYIFFTARVGWHPDETRMLHQPLAAGKSHLERHWPKTSSQFSLWDRCISKLHDEWLWHWDDIAGLWSPKQHLESILDVAEAMQGMLDRISTHNDG